TIMFSVLAKQGSFFPKKKNPDPRNPAGPRGADLVGPIERDLSRTRERELLLVFGDDLKDRIVLERYDLLRRHVIGHRLEQLLGVCLIGSRSGERTTQPKQQGQHSNGQNSLSGADSRRNVGGHLHLRLVFIIVSFPLFHVVSFLFISPTRSHPAATLIEPSPTQA